jgi:hypothetical protein
MEKILLSKLHFTFVSISLTLLVWEYDSMACPQTIVRLYRGMMKEYVNQTNTYEGSTVIVEHQDKDQAAGLELTEPFIW